MSPRLSEPGPAAGERPGAGGGTRRPPPWRPRRSATRPRSPGRSPAIWRPSFACCPPRPTPWPWRPWPSRARRPAPPWPPSWPTSPPRSRSPPTRPDRHAGFMAQLAYAVSRVVSVRRVDAAGRGPDAVLAQAERRADDGDPGRRGRHARHPAGRAPERAWRPGATRRCGGSRSTAISPACAPRPPPTFPPCGAPADGPHRPGDLRGRGADRSGDLPAGRTGDGEPDLARLAGRHHGGGRRAADRPSGADGDHLLEHPGVAAAGAGQGAPRQRRDSAAGRPPRRSRAASWPRPPGMAPNRAAWRRRPPRSTRTRRSWCGSWPPRRRRRRGTAPPPGPPMAPCWASRTCGWPRTGA